MSFTDTYGFDPYSYTNDFDFPDFTGGSIETGFFTPEGDLFGGGFGTSQGGAATQGSGGFFGDLTAGGLLKGLAPIGASLIGGNLANQAAQGYGQSSAEAAAIIAMANQQAQEQQFGFGLKGQQIAGAQRINDANQQLTLQNSAPFRNIQTRRGAQSIAASGVPTSNALAGRYQMMFA